MKMIIIITMVIKLGSDHDLVTALHCTASIYDNDIDILIQLKLHLVIFALLGTAISDVSYGMN